MARLAITKGHSIIMFSCCEHCFHTREEGRPLSFPNHGEMCPNASCSASTFSNAPIDAMQLLEGEETIYAIALNAIQMTRAEYVAGHIDRAGVLARINEIHSVTCAG